MGKLQHLEAAAQLAEPSLVFGFLPNPPPPWLGYITALIAFGILVVHIVKYVSERYSDKKKRFDDINDSFWFRSVVVPAVIEPLIKFMTEQGEMLQKLNTAKKEDFSKFLKDFQKGKESIASRLLLLNLVNQEMYTDAIAEFDEIEDDITLLCAVKLGDLDQDEYNKQKYTEVNALVTRMCAGLNAMLGKIKSHHLTHLS